VTACSKLQAPSNLSKPSEQISIKSIQHVDKKVTRMFVSLQGTEKQWLMFVMLENYF